MNPNFQISDLIKLKEDVLLIRDARKFLDGERRISRNSLCFRWNPCPNIEFEIDCHLPSNYSKYKTILSIKGDETFYLTGPWDQIIELSYHQFCEEIKMALEEQQKKMKEEADQFINEWEGYAKTLMEAHC